MLGANFQHWKLALMAVKNPSSSQSTRLSLTSIVHSCTIELKLNLFFYKNLNYNLDSH